MMPHLHWFPHSIVESKPVGGFHDALMQEQPGIDHLADRLSAVEFALREGLDASAQTQQHFRTIMS